MLVVSKSRYFLERSPYPVEHESDQMALVFLNRVAKAQSLLGCEDLVGLDWRMSYLPNDEKR